MMMEPWNLKKDDERPADSLSNFIIFCEDGEIEPEYFRCFSSTNKINITTLCDCKKQHQQVDYATDYCRDNGLLEFHDGRERLKLDEGTQVWCVFDRDKENGDGKDTSFTDSIITAESKGIRVSWSNDDFELWILLHFEEVNPADPTFQNRVKYYERLTDILRNTHPLSEQERQITRNERFDYYNAMKRKHRFLQITLQHMKGKTGIAIERSRILETFHKQPPKPQHEMSPCTMVHHLVHELIALGGNPI